jgi:hypothetical protein
LRLHRVVNTAFKSRTGLAEHFQEQSALDRGLGLHIAASERCEAAVDPTPCQNLMNMRVSQTIAVKMIVACPDLSQTTR